MLTDGLLQMLKLKRLFGISEGGDGQPSPRCLPGVPQGSILELNPEPLGPSAVLKFGVLRLVFSKAAKSDFWGSVGTATRQVPFVLGGWRKLIAASDARHMFLWDHLG